MSSGQTEETRLFGDGERALLASVLDEIIPGSADGAFQGAGALGVADYLERALTQRPGLGPIVSGGLSALEASARSRKPGGFEALSRSERALLLREVEARDPTFFGILFLCAYTGYYTDPRVVEHLGLRPQPQPEGYDLEPGDLDTLLQPVRERCAKLYREC